MSTNLLTVNIWNTLRTEAKRLNRPADVAVAYFGQGAAGLLPLPRGSRLVVDASEAAVKSGRTCPAELRKLANRGVQVYSVLNLHAKIFVFGRKAYIGSANVSRHSAATLVEAMVSTTDRRTVSAARSFVRSLCLYDLGPEALARLGAIYRPPRLPKGHGSRGPRPKNGHTVVLPPLRIAQLKRVEPPEGSEKASEAGRKVAVKRMEKPRSHHLDEFFWHGKCTLREREVVLQVVDEGGGRRMVSPPGTVLETLPWRSGTRSVTFVYLELPKQRRMSLEKLAARLGRGAKKRLRRSGPVKREFANRLLEAWKR